jgi:hypothetical protein
MSISFTGLTPSNYIGTTYAIPFTLVGRPGINCVPLSFNWAAYGAGNNNQNILVPMNFSSAPGQVRQMLTSIKSVYIDNTGSAVPVYVQCTDTLWTVVCQGFSAGWYPLFTNAFTLNIAALGFTNQNVASARVTIINTAPYPYTDVGYQAVLNQNLSSPTIGGGAGIAAIVPTPGSNSYNNGNLSIVGGGGNAAAAVGILDQWGQFVGVDVEDEGVEFTGTPVITATGGQTIPAVFNPASTYTPLSIVTYGAYLFQWGGGPNSNQGLDIVCNAATYNSGVSYLVNQQVLYGADNYQRTAFNPGVIGVSPVESTLYWTHVGQPVPTGTGWIASGLVAGATASFSATLTPQVNQIVSPGYAIPALGDQASSYEDLVTGGGQFRQNLFGSPYNSGFIYLTHIYIAVAGISSNSITVWQIVDVAGTVLFTMATTTAQTVLEIQKANIKIDATQNWTLNCTTLGGHLTPVLHNFVWTYSQQ